jgi:predicted ATP-binding protein involved in virulence
MKLKKISLYGLFGLFDHVLPLQENERITIIHAPNGFGKTTILKLIHAFYSGNELEILNTPFTRMVLDFDDGGSLAINKEKTNSPEEGEKAKEHAEGLPLKERLSYSYNRADGKTLKYVPRFNMENIKKILLNIIEDVSNDDDPFNDYIARYNNIFDDPASAYNLLSKKAPELDMQPEWLIKLRSQIPVRYIASQRLYQSRRVDRQQKKQGGHERSSYIEPSVMVYSENIKDIVNEQLSKYAELSEKLDRTFPSRLAQKMMDFTLDKISSNEILGQEETISHLKELEERRTRLIEVGLLDKGTSTPVPITEKMEDHTRLVLSMYISDTRLKLAVFDGIEKKINLMRNIINKQFINKKLVIDKDRGFMLQMPDGSLLSPDKLSSGEQHELVLNYDLLFNSRPGSLILIDEPEISLHIMWQQSFIRDLKEISRLSDLDILIATHSPQIIDDFWDLTVELKGAKVC